MKMNNNVAIRKYEEKDIFSMITIWNEVVELSLIHISEPTRP